MVRHVSFVEKQCGFETRSGGRHNLFIAIVIINYAFRSSLPSVPTGISSSIIISVVSFFMT